MSPATRIAELLINIGAVQLSVDPPFTWTSGIKSPIYCDNRMLYSHPEARDFVVEGMIDRINALQVDPDAIVGTATAAIGWAALVADRLKLPFAYVRSKAKEHGAKKRVEGDLGKGKHIVVVEDLISTGGSALSTVEALRTEADATVSDVVAIFTYEFLTAIESAQEAGIRFHALSDFSTLLEVAADQGRLEKESINKARTFAKDPQNWGS